MWTRWASAPSADLRRPQRRALRLHPPAAQARVARPWSSRRVRRRPRDSGGLRHGRERCLPRRSGLRLLQGARGRRLRDHRHRRGRGRHVRGQTPSRHAAPRGRSHAGKDPSHRGRTLRLPEPRELSRGARPGPAIAARWGKPAAELADNDEVWALEGDYLGQMCANLVLMYSPRRIVLGGGVITRSSSTASSARRPSNIWVATSRPPSLRTWRATSAPRAAAATKESSARPSWQEGRSRNLRSLRHTTR